MPISENKSPGNYAIVPGYQENPGYGSNRGKLLTLAALTCIVLTGILTAYFVVSMSKKTPCEKRIAAYFNVDSSEELTESQLANLTHVIFYPMIIQSDGSVSFPGRGQQKDKFERLAALARNSSVKTMISMAMGGSMAETAADPNKRKVLLDSVNTFVQENSLDGVDIFWKWPETERDHSNLITLARELREKLPKPYIISQLVPPSPKQLDLQKEMSEFVDFLNVDVDHYFGVKFYENNYNWPEKTDKTMQKYFCQMEDINKLNMVFSAVGVTYDNINGRELTTEPARSGWHFWRNLKRHGWDVSRASWNNKTNTPYIWNQNRRTYLAFENERSLAEKVKYVMDRNIGGMTFYEINSDDDENTMLNVIATARQCAGRSSNSIKFDCDGI
ncbi:unnamed protein product [Caenorhabditis brenneri]